MLETRFFLLQVVAFTFLLTFLLVTHSAMAPFHGLNNFGCPLLLVYNNASEVFELICF